ncbi:stage II sporulation protein P [Pseudoflavonifractor sp. MSJ-37]|uniref:stage II sporulation protein P n=1 Tax=Pseudoflavonifractor sp. MSJ-37 TaxID=2841531 RepID=UPI001C119644|nr:stage II sporulation protein P [Pseudoflavonifractor sp. MSJ-37]MBU5435303.1 stage II sporulation protein P [Pseudoflavonifractor sp. MSJ-37]
MKRQERICWGLVLRRTGAFCLAAAGIWLLLAGTGSGQAAEALHVLGDDPAFLTAALQAELGSGDGSAAEQDALGPWERLVVGQSPLLRQMGLDLSGGEAAGPVRTPEPSAAPTAVTPAPASGGEDAQEAPAPPATSPEDIVERTLVPTSTEGYAYADGLYLYNRTDLSVDLAAAASAAVDITLPKEGPEILIVHTHATEAYAPDGADTYAPTDANSRTLDETQNMIRVGDEMARVFQEMGLDVLHDKGAYDYPAYQGAYGRSGAAVADYLARYPSIQLVLDVHRDALVGNDGTVYKAVTKVDGEKTAQVMLVVGSGSGHPNWMANLALAAKIQKSLDGLYPTLARPMTLRGSVYNQELSPGSLLVEVGSHGNTLQEALRAARCFARAAGQVYLGLMDH